MLDTVDLLSSRLNFTYQLVIPPGVPNIGIKEANGSWTGLIGLLERHVSISTISTMNYYDIVAMDLSRRSMGLEESYYFRGL